MVYIRVYCPSVQCREVVGVCHQECAGEGEGEEQEMFPRVLPTQSQTECGLRHVVYQASHSGMVVVVVLLYFMSESY